jgi:hypothetical protein
VDSRSISNGLLFASSHGDKCFQSSHVVGSRLVERLSERNGSSFWFSLSLIARVRNSMTMHLLILIVQRMGSFHNGRRRPCLVLFESHAWWMSFDVAIRMADGWVILCHRGVRWGWHAFAAARIFRRSPLDSPASLIWDSGRNRPIVPSHALVLFRRDGRFLRASRRFPRRRNLDRLGRPVRLLLAEVVRMWCRGRPRRRSLYRATCILRPLLARRIGAGDLEAVDALDRRVPGDARSLLMLL